MTTSIAALEELRRLGVKLDLYRIEEFERFGLKVPDQIRRHYVKLIVSALGKPQLVYRVERFDSLSGDRWLDELEPLPGLAEICLNGCLLAESNDEETLSIVQKMGKLEKLFLSQCRITDRMLAKLKSESLEILCLSANIRVTNDCLVELAQNLPNLKRITLSDTRVEQKEAERILGTRGIVVSYC